MYLISLSIVKNIIFLRLSLHCSWKAFLHICGRFFKFFSPIWVYTTSIKVYWTIEKYKIKWLVNIIELEKHRPIANKKKI